MRFCEREGFGMGGIEGNCGGVGGDDEIGVGRDWL